MNNKPPTNLENCWVKVSLSVDSVWKCPSATQNNNSIAISSQESQNLKYDGGKRGWQEGGEDRDMLEVKNGWGGRRKAETQPSDTF